MIGKNCRTSDKRILQGMGKGVGGIDIFHIKEYHIFHPGFIQAGAEPQVILIGNDEDEGIAHEGQVFKCSRPLKYRAEGVAGNRIGDSLQTIRTYPDGTLIIAADNCPVFPGRKCHRDTGNTREIRSGNKRSQFFRFYIKIFPVIIIIPADMTDDEFQSLCLFIKGNIHPIFIGKPLDFSFGQL